MIFFRYLIQFFIEIQIFREFYILITKNTKTSRTHLMVPDANTLQPNRRAYAHIGKQPAFERFLPSCNKDDRSDMLALAIVQLACQKNPR